MSGFDTLVYAINRNSCSPFESPQQVGTCFGIFGVALVLLVLQAAF